MQLYFLVTFLFKSSQLIRRNWAKWWCVIKCQSIYILLYRIYHCIKVCSCRTSYWHVKETCMNEEIQWWTCLMLKKWSTTSSNKSGCVFIYLIQAIRLSFNSGKINEDSKDVSYLCAHVSKSAQIECFVFF